MTQLLRQELVAEFVDRLAHADRMGSISRAQELLGEGVSREELLEVVRESQREVGRLWQVNAWTIAQEHAATSVSESILQAIGVVRIPSEDRGHVAVVCADGEWHVLPARMLAERLVQADYRVTFIGGSVPPEHLHGYLPTLHVDAVAISCTLALNLAGAARSVAAVHALGLPAVVGGAAFGTDDRRATAIGADGWAPDADVALAVLERWHHADHLTVRATPRLNEGEQADLLRLVPELVDEAFDVLRARIPAIADYSDWQLDRTRDDLGYHLRHLASAILVGDDAVYLDMIPWLTDLLLARGLVPQVVHATIDILDEVLAPRGMAQARRILVAAHAAVPGA